MKKTFTFLPGLGSSKHDVEESDTNYALRKRRDQLRKAQRTHRQRKNQYFKTLENEVLRLRASEVRLGLQVQELQNRIATLQATLQTHNIPLLGTPRGGLLTSETDGSALNLHSWNTEPSTRLCALEVNIEAQPVRSPECNNQGIGHTTTLQAAFSIEPKQTLTPSGINYNESGELDKIGAGMDFVLTLERPCLPHLDLYIDKPNGHCLLASSTLIHPRDHRPHLRKPTCEHDYGIRQISGKDGSFPSDPGAIFSTLLALSAKLVSDDELSPTQAWFNILQQPWAHKLDGKKVKDLSMSLMTLVKCYGYGAVMNKDAFIAVLNNTASYLK